ncbi:Nonribosomal peptide synthetase asaC [Metarhizium anisopliae]|nr:Nonribosomal peptide synthetase asaC [Metarhizium anisopliae]
MDFTSHISDHDIAGLLSRNVVCHGNRNAIIDGSLSITYQQLDLKAKEISLDLIQQGVAYQDPVGILTAFGLPHLIAQVGVVYAGATCVPLDSERSDAELAAQLHVAHVKFLVVDDMHRDRQLSAEKVVLIRDPNIELLRDKTQGIPKPLQPSFRSHILFTSGTTGTPKGVQIPAAGIVRIARDPLCKAVSGEDTVGYLNNPCFDVSLIDIWCSLINGTTIVVTDRRELLSPGLFARSLKKQQVTFAFLPTALFHMVALACPTAFSEMNTLIVGGEGLSIEPCKAVLEHGPPRRLINGYGPTECTILACGHQITWKDVQDAASGYLPIGRPLWKTVAHVFDDSLRPVTGNNQGELYLGGAGLSMGYLEAPDAQRTGFVTVPGLGPRGEPSRLYRTKDAVCRDDAGNLVWVGRMDREVKMRGYRIPLDVIESEILCTGLVSSVVAAKVNLPDANMSLLVACVTYLPSGGGSVSPCLLARCQARLLTDCTRLGIFPLLPNQREELVTVDYVASAMRLISTSNDNLGRAYHLVPDLDSSIDMNTLFRLVGKAANVTMTGLPYHDWLDRIRTAVENASELRLKPLLPMLEEKVLGERTRIELYEGMARFKRENTIDALRKTGCNGFLREAAVNEKDLQAYVRFLQSQD